MRFCGQCGQARDLQATFCRSCGASFAAASPVPPPPPPSAAAPPPPPPAPGWGHQAPFPVPGRRSAPPTRLKLLGNIVAGSLYALAGLAGVLAVAAAAQWATWRTFLGTPPGSSAELDAVDANQTATDIHTMVLGLSVIAAVLVACCFLTWLFQAARNVETFGATGTLAPGWAIGSWFIPMANAVLPCLVVNQIWKASHPNLPHPVGAFWSQVRQPGLVLGWWLSFILAGATSNLAFGLEPTGPDSLGAADWSYFFYLVSALLTVAAGVLGALVVRRLTDRQEARIDALWPTAQPPYPPFPAYASPGSAPAALVNGGGAG